MPVPSADSQGIAIFGGTFDPVHFGHLRSAIEVREALGVSRVKLVPSYSPPHRDAPGSTAADRLAMLKLAVGESEFLEVDEREIVREGRSFMIDTLRSMREEFGALEPLSLIVGFDAYLILDQWKEWKELLHNAHVVVLNRPGSDESAMSRELASLFEERLVDNPLCLHSKPNGLMARLDLTQLDISSTQVREIFRTGKSAEYIVPMEVIQYIKEHRLYRATPP